MAHSAESLESFKSAFTLHYLLYLAEYSSQRSADILADVFATAGVTFVEKALYFI